MNWKNYLYIPKGDKIAIILLLILIVLSGGIYIILRSSQDKVQVSNLGSEEQSQQLLAKSADLDTAHTTLQKDIIPKDQSKKNTQIRYPYQEKLKTGETIEINTADTTELKKIPGIGSAYANRIIKYRNLLGGYATLEQLKEVWGIDNDIYNNIFPYLTITPKTKWIKINSATFEDINRHPYISYKQAKIITDIRERKGNIESVNRLSLLEEFTKTDINRLTPYISFE